MKYATLIAALVVAVAGCSPASPEAATEQAANPKTRVEGGPELGLTIDLPDDWVTVDLTNPEWRKALQAEMETDPDVAKIEPLIPLRPADSPTKLVAFDVRKSGAGFTDNMNIVVLPVPEAITLDMLIEANLKQMEGIQKPGTSFATKKVTLGGQNAGLVTWGMMSGENTITMRTYFAMQKGKYYTITFSCLAQRKGGYLKQVEGAMSSLRFTAPS